MHYGEGVIKKTYSLYMYIGFVCAYFFLALVQHSDHPDTQRIPLLFHDGSDCA